VPAHDQRDFEFARKFGLPIKIVIRPQGISILESEDDMTMAVPASGTMVNSGPLTGTPGDQSFTRAIEYIQKLGIGKAATNFRLRDWLISRQRYWGSPIPMIHCPQCGAVPVPEDQLPVTLPEDVEWKPTGESPLKLHPTWRFVTGPKCGGKAERETDTMDTFMCSSWYHLRYLSPNYDKGPFNPKEYDYWMPVDTYTGGVEHATMHLIYTRFFHKAFRDLGVVKGDEPMIQLRNQGQILGPDGQRMSKSRGNVIDPGEQVRLYGADTVRAYLMFGYRWQDGGLWDPGNIQGSHRWLRRIWEAFLEEGDQGKPAAAQDRRLLRKVHQTLKAITRDFEEFEFNTIISALMELLNEMISYKEKGGWNSPVWHEAVDIYLRMMAPAVPHIAEEIWARLGKPYSIHQQKWPNVDEDAAREEEIELVVQVNGKLRDKINASVDISEDQAKKLALESKAVQKYLGGKSPRKIIYVPERLVNIVV